MYRKYLRLVSAHPKEDAEKRRKLLRGDFDETYHRDSKIVRIFTSSTFTDTAFERNALMENVYPKLKKHCTSQGYEFQVVDMRWGIRHGANNDHSTTELCLKEITDCKALSTGPYFVTFLSHKYGHRPLPRTIPQPHFSKLKQNIKGERNLRLLHKWYKLDENAIPPVYTMQKISDNIPDFISTDKQKQQEANKQWDEESNELSHAINTAAKAEGDTYDIYSMSVTEREITEGIHLKSNKVENEFSFWFRRVIDNIYNESHENLTPEDAKHLQSFKEIETKRGLSPAEAKSRIETLGKSLEKALPLQNINERHVAWKEVPHRDSNPENHGSLFRNHIDKFCTDFERKIRMSIDLGISKKSRQGLSDPLCQEVMQHLIFCNEKRKVFYGRKSFIEDIRAAVMDQNIKRFVIHGESGCGKTSIMAEIGKQIKSWLGKEDAVLVLRFIGTTPNSSSLRQLLLSINAQMQECYRSEHADEEIENVSSTEENNLTIDKLRHRFDNILLRATADKPLVIMLDSLDQFSEDHDPDELNWIPNKLPPNVYLFMSTLPNKEYKYLQNLRQMFSKEEHCKFMAVPPIERGDAKDIIDSWFGHSKRKLTEKQNKTIQQTIEQNQLPLFLKLCFDESRKWTSYTEISNCILQNTVQKAIVYMFKTIEKKHGKLLTQRTFAYITASRHGLSEIELEDILSCDDDVLTDVFEWWVPTIIRLPPLLLVRIKADVAEYLVERGSEGTKVIFWYHRQFIETARKRYLHDEAVKLQVHKNIAEYFLGKWANAEKLFEGGKRKRYDTPHPKNRYVTPQPTNQSNLRKLGELGYQLIAANMYEPLNDNIFMDLSWHIARIKAFSYRDLMNDITKSIEEMSAKGHDCSQWIILKQILNLSEHALLQTAELWPSQALGRTEDLRLPEKGLNKSLKDLDHFKRQCKEYGGYSNNGYQLLTTTRSLTAPGGELLYCLTGHDWAPNHAILTQDGQFAITGGNEGIIRIWDITKGTEQKEIHTPGKENNERHIKHMFLCCDDKYIAAAFRRRITIFDRRTGKRHAQSDVKTDFGYDGFCTMCTLFDQKSELVIAIKYVLRRYDVETGTLTEAILPEQKKPKNLLLSKGDWLYFAYRNKLITILHAEAVTEKRTLFSIELKEGVRTAACTPSGSKLLVHGVHGLFVILDAKDGTLQKEFKKEDIWNLNIEQLSFTSETEFFGASGRNVILGTTKSGVQNSLFTHPYIVNKVVATSDRQKFLTTTSRDFVVRVWTAKSEKLMQSNKAHQDEPVKALKLIPGTTRYVLVLTATGRGGKSCLRVYDIIDRTTIRTIHVAVEIQDVKVFSTKDVLACDTNKKLHHIDLDELCLKQTLPGYSGSGCFYVLDSSNVVCLSKSCSGIKMIDLTTGVKQTSIKVGDKETLYPEFFVSKDGSLAVCVQRTDNREKRLFVVISLASQTIMHKFEVITKNAVSPSHRAQVSNNNRYLLVRERNVGDIVHVWCLQQGKQIQEIKMGKMLDCYEETEGLKFVRYEEKTLSVEVFDAVTGEPEGLFRIDEQLHISHFAPDVDDKRQHYAFFSGGANASWLYNTHTWEKYACFMADTEWQHTLMTDNTTIVATNLNWNAGDTNNVHVVMLHKHGRMFKSPPRVLNKKYSETTIRVQDSKDNSESDNQ